jgi:hypothetical protein
MNYKILTKEKYRIGDQWRFTKRCCELIGQKFNPKWKPIRGLAGYSDNSIIEVRRPIVEESRKTGKHSKGRSTLNSRGKKRLK